MTRAPDIFQSPFDDQYYFWLGDSTKGPYAEYVAAHVALTEALMEANGKSFKESLKDYSQSRC